MCYSPREPHHSHCVKHNRGAEDVAYGSCPVSVDSEIHSCHYEGDSQEIRYTLGSQFVPKLVVETDDSEEFKT